jgi:hypothetical protein
VRISGWDDKLRRNKGKNRSLKTGHYKNKSKKKASA